MTGRVKLVTCDQTSFQLTCHLINYDVSENRVKNIIYDSMTKFIADAGELESAVYDKIKSYKRRVIPGTDEYEILYEKFYKDELARRGLA